MTRIAAWSPPTQPPADVAGLIWSVRTAFAAGMGVVKAQDWRRAWFLYCTENRADPDRKRIRRTLDASMRRLHGPAARRAADGKAVDGDGDGAADGDFGADGGTTDGDGDGAADGGAVDGGTADHRTDGDGAADGGAADGGTADHTTDGDVATDGGSANGDGDGAADGNGGADGSTTDGDGDGEADGGAGADGGTADHRADGDGATGGGATDARAPPPLSRCQCWHGDGDLLDAVDADGVPMFREALSGAKKWLLVYTTPPATVTPETLEGVSAAPPSLHKALQDINGSIYVGIKDNTACGCDLATAMGQVARQHSEANLPVRRGVRRIAGSHGTLSVNALAAENVGAVIDWDLTEMSKYAPPFISGSNSKDVKAEWKVRSEASSIRLQRGRGRDGLGGAVGVASEGPPLDWCFPSKVLPGLLNQNLRLCIFLLPPLPLRPRHCRP